MLVVLSAVVVLSPGIPVAAPNPLLLVGVATLNGTVGLALFQLGVLRFGAGGRPLDLYVGFAFGTLAVANLGVRVLGPLVGLGPSRLEAHLILLLLAQALAIGLFLLGLVASARVVDPDRRPGYALRVAGALVLGLIVAAGVIQRAEDSLPPALDLPSRQLLDNHVVVPDVLAGQAPWLLVVEAAFVLLLIVAAIGYMRLAWRTGDASLGALGVALTFLAFGECLTLLFPPVADGYVSASDTFRLTGYLVLLASLVARLANEIAAEAARDERLRLSRELHDGLAQVLSLLHLRLHAAMSPTRASEARADDLERAQRLVEMALLEARQVITVLRGSRVSWEEFTRALAGFADDFSRNHEVEIALATAGELSELDGRLQAELLRLLHEAASNAVRHGGATRLDVTVAAAGGGLELTVRDNGSGFELNRALASRGVGLNSMVERLQRRGGKLTIDSSPGCGATVRAELPIQWPEVRDH